MGSTRSSGTACIELPRVVFAYSPFVLSIRAIAVGWMDVICHISMIVSKKIEYLPKKKGVPISLLRLNRLEGKAAMRYWNFLEGAEPCSSWKGDDIADIFHPCDELNDPFKTQTKS